MSKEEFLALVKKAVDKILDTAFDEGISMSIDYQIAGGGEKNGHRRNVQPV